MASIVKKLEERSSKLQEQIKGLLNDDGSLGSENREKFERMEGELHGVEQSLRYAKDAELEELRAQVEDGGKRGAARESDEEKRARAFKQFLRSGEEGVEQRDSLSAGSNANGGFVVPENLHAELVEAVRAVNPVSRLATTFSLTGSASIELPRKAKHGVVSFVDETAARPETAAPTFANDTLTAFEVYSDQRATQLFLDEVDGAEQMLLRWIYADIAEAFEQKCVNGKGDSSKEPAGLFEAKTFYKTSKVKAAGTVTAADILNAYFALAPEFRANGTFLVNSGTMAQLAQMTHPAAAGTVPFLDFDGPVPTILGKPVEECQAAPAVGASAFPIAFGDIARAYAVAVHKTPTIIRDPFTARPKVSFYALARMGGRPWNPEACVLLSTEQDG